MKIDLRKVYLTEDEYGDFIIHDIENEEKEAENLTELMREMVELGKPLNIRVWKARMGGGSGNRKPTYKYICRKCGKEIKSSEDGLEVKCMKCNILYEKIR